MRGAILVETNLSPSHRAQVLSGDGYVVDGDKCAAMCVVGPNANGTGLSFGPTQIYCCVGEIGDAGSWSDWFSVLDRKL